MLGGGLGRGGGGGGGPHFPFYPRDQGRGGGRGRGRGRRRPPPKEGALVVLLQLDDTLRGIVIGRQGAAIKETQRVSGAQLTLPKRGETGPVRVSGPTAQTVMHAARLVARQTAAEQAEIACTCSVAGSDIAATLRYSHILFEGAGFVAFCLPASACPPADEIDVLLDDTAFALGAGADLAWAASAGDDTFVYGLGAGEPVARALHAKLASATAAAAEAAAAAAGGDG